MRFMSMPIFWGIIVVLFGLSIILKHLFNVHIPFFRVLIGIIVIMFGISIIIGSYKKHSNTTVFSETKFKNIYKNYNIIFGTGIIDLTDAANINIPEKIEVNTVFGSSVIYIDREKEFYIRGNSAFGYIQMPDGDNIVFGDIKRTYGSSSQKAKIIVNNVFARTSVVYK